MKTPDEIKKGLECSLTEMCAGRTCPYWEDHDLCIRRSRADAVALIQQLESKLNQAVEDFRLLGRMGANICPICAYHNHGEGTSGECVKCLTGDGFRWRGEKEEEHAD